jgi:ribokinase
MTDATAGSMPPRHVVVIGSVNMDLVVRTRMLPRPGETVIGRDFAEVPGGKGANQAVAAARLGARTTMIGCVGDDLFGQRLRQSLVSEHVDVRHLATVAECSSGVAVICVEDSGQNCITVVPGANARLMPDMLQPMSDLIRQADVLLLQLEIPVETVLAAMTLARQHGILTVLDPAPAIQAAPPHLLQVDVLCPNETEAEVLSGIDVHTEGDAARAARRLQTLGARQVIITMGERGALLCDASGVCEMVPACIINPVDTTAAGDAFAAAVAVQLAEQHDLRQSVRFACAAGAAAASRMGAQPSLPNRRDIAQILALQRTNSR